ncbi:hypothetical protein ACHAW5_006463 [Stephanodiscus triporus]|uniref:DNA 3'-5' helicase n=1 Tax=Stephanodiscus triporus TaxID=2934178 RepID=A0ABD3NYF4_9STRA
MDDDDANQEGSVDEYSSARKLVQRAADREALLKSFGVGEPSFKEDADVVRPAVPGSADAAGSSTSSSSGDVVAVVPQTQTQPPAQSSSSLGSDFSGMRLKRDHFSRPCWTCPDGTIYLEATHALYATAHDFLVAIGEPVTRPEYVHEYRLTPYSLYAAVATNIDTESIVRVLERYSKNALPSSVVAFVRECTKSLDYPLMEEYDFRNDKFNPDVPMDLKPHTRIRRYQERSLSKMFGNGRARSGIIVLPCGAGKTLTGVTAAQTIKKSVVCLCTNAVSVLQWKYQFKLWTNIPDDHISVFTSDIKDDIHPTGGCVLITTYTMISYGGQRSDKSAEVMRAIRGREWGLLLMDEVHVVPAKMFRRVIGSVKAHCRLGLTATLVREDDLISDLNFLIGPKLYEANWMDLTTQGYLANVQCVEVWCPMTGPFMREYLSADNGRLKQLLYVMNPSKLRAAEFLVRFHEDRGDKIIVFSDLVYSLKLYAAMLKRPMIYGETSERERQAILGTFRTSDALRTICISKVGDTSIDLPEANVIIQVSSHFGSRRQEAQRLGRILRPKSYTQTDGSNRSSFNAFFYTLVSTDTQEMFYSTKRQQYLIDQGYTFKIVTTLSERADLEALEHGYAYKNPDDDRKLLRTVLTSDTALEKDQRAEDTAIRKNNPDGARLADLGIKRTAGSTLAQLSGGTGARYIAGPRKVHPMFAKRKKPR